LGQDASIEPSIIKISLSVRPVKKRKKKVGNGKEGKDGLWFKMVQQRDISRMRQDVPRETIVTKFCTQINDTDCAKFGDNHFTYNLVMADKNACFNFPVV